MKCHSTMRELHFAGSKPSEATRIFLIGASVARKPEKRQAPAAGADGRSTRTRQTRKLRCPGTAVAFSSMHGSTRPDAAIRERGCTRRPQQSTAIPRSTSSNTYCESHRRQCTAAAEADGAGSCLQYISEPRYVTWSSSADCSAASLESNVERRWQPRGLTE